MQTKQDRRWVILMSIFLLGLTSIPYLIGYFRQGADWHFTGFVFGVEDGNSYIAKMMSGSYGSWLFRSPYTSMHQKGALAFLPYILLGKLAFPPEIHDQLVALYQIFRWVSGGLLIWAVFSFVGLFLADDRQKKIAALVILLGGGLGWLGWLLFPGQWTGRLPLELYSPEAFGFLALLGLPHLSAARAFLLFGLIFFLKSDDSAIWRREAIFGGLCWFVVGFFQPLTIIVGYGILGCTLALTFLAHKGTRRQSTLPLLKKAAVMAGIALPWVVYNVFFFSSDPYLQAWYRQNIIDSPPPGHYIWSFAAFVIAAIPTMIHTFQKKAQRELLLWSWVVCAVLLAYFPYNVQRRFIDGIWIALVLLVFMSFRIIKRRFLNMCYRVLLGLTFISPILVLMIVTQGVWTVSKPVYRLDAEIFLFKEIAKKAKPGDTVLAAYNTANPMPAWAPVYVLAGHGPESANLKTVEQEIQAFYSGLKDDLWQEDFLLQNSVDFIIFGPNERLLDTGKTFPGRTFEKIYDQFEYQLYRVDFKNGN